MDGIRADLQALGSLQLYGKRMPTHTVETVSFLSLVMLAALVKKSPRTNSFFYLSFLF